jgi:dephospho-CoA kinase
VLAFSGPIGSGKTTIARQTAQTLDWKLASFGDFVRKEARRRRLDDQSRDVLQDLGDELIRRGWEGFCRAVLADSGWVQGQGLIVDGIRHVEGMEAVRALVRPVPLLLVYVQIDERTRSARLYGRDALGSQELQRIDSHNTEQQVKEVLKDIADIVVDGRLPTESIVKGLIHQLDTESGK